MSTPSVDDQIAKMAQLQADSAAIATAQTTTSFAVQTNLSGSQLASSAASGTGEVAKSAGRDLKDACKSV